MTTDRDYDLITTAWLAAGPEELPDRVIDAVIEEIHVARQRHARHLPSMFPTMTLPARVAVAALIGALAVGGAFLVFGRSGQPAVGGPAASRRPSSVVVMPALTATYASARNGFTIDYPAGWSTLPATANWVSGQTLVWGVPALDTIQTSDVRLVMSSQPVDRGQTPAAWYQAECDCDVATMDTIEIDGATGYRDADGGSPPFTGIVPDGVIFGAEVVSGGRGYQFVMDGHVDRAMFDAFLATFKFPVIPALDRAYTAAIAGYSIDYPSDWTVTPATKQWTGGYDTMTYSDQIGNASTFYGTSRKLPAGVSFEDWFAAYDADRVKGTCGAPSLNEDVTVDGVIGHLDVHCPAMYLEAVIPKGGRVYVMTMFQPFTRPLFAAFLATVRLTPETATP